ncbi:MAG: hypothetical protein LZF60_160158 [Nitrospira sp.]|nr:MAG: hypothetical protein LZF60_160158 [Nitrospira sp.]
MITCDAACSQSQPVFEEESNARWGSRRSFLLRNTPQGIDVIKDDPQWTWQKELVLQVIACYSLEPNWDSYGGLSPSIETVWAAIELIDSIPQFDPPRPRIVPLATGGIQFEWRLDQKELDIEVAEDGSYRSLKFDPSSSANDTEKELPLTSLSEVKGLLSWLVSDGTFQSV